MRTGSIRYCPDTFCPVSGSDGIAEEVNEKLQQVGEVSIGALTTQYDLPSEFLEKVRDHCGSARCPSGR